MVGADGGPVSDATVVVKGGAAEIDDDPVKTATTGANGKASVEVDPCLRPNQEDGTLVVDIKPPAGSEFGDKRENTKILVVRD